MPFFPGSEPDELEREAKILNCQEQEKLHMAEGSDSERWTLLEGQEPAHS